MIDIITTIITALIAALISGLILFIIQIIMKWYDSYSIMFGQIYKLHNENTDEYFISQIRNYKINSMEKEQKIADIISMSGLPIYMVKYLLKLNKSLKLSEDIIINIQDENRDTKTTILDLYNIIQNQFPSFKKLLFCFLIKNTN